jgi:hypothetical protein
MGSLHSACVPDRRSVSRVFEFSNTPANGLTAGCPQDAVARKPLRAYALPTSKAEPACASACCPQERSLSTIYSSVVDHFGTGAAITDSGTYRACTSFSTASVSELSTNSTHTRSPVRNGRSASITASRTVNSSTIRVTTPKPPSSANATPATGVTFPCPRSCPCGGQTPSSDVFQSRSFDRVRTRRAIGFCVSAKKSLPLSSTTTNAGKSSTSIFQTASMPSS